MTGGTGSPHDVEPADRRVVTLQLDREPRGTWCVAARCRWGRPTVIAVAPRLEDGAPFPTTLWLTCPHLSRLVDDVESAGSPAEWTARIAADPALAAGVREADERYRALRRMFGRGEDPCAGVGVAGQADPLVVKCLHARVAAFLGDTGDPVGEAILSGFRDGQVPTECGDDRCAPPTDRRGGSGIG